MTLFEFVLPLHTNRGLSYEIARKAWEAYVLEQAGGYSKQPWADGVWRDPASRRVYAERTAAYRVGCEPAVKDRILGKTFELFPDQLAICIAEIGTLQNVSKPVSENPKEAA